MRFLEFSVVVVIVVVVVVVVLVVQFNVLSTHSRPKSEASAHTSKIYFLQCHSMFKVHSILFSKYFLFIYVFGCCDMLLRLVSNARCTFTAITFSAPGRMVTSESPSHGSWFNRIFLSGLNTRPEIACHPPLHVSWTLRGDAQ